MLTHTRTSIWTHAHIHTQSTHPGWPMIWWHWHGCCFCGYFRFLCGGGRCGRWHRWIRLCCGQWLYRPIDIRWFSGSCMFNELTYNHYSFVDVWLTSGCRCCCKRCDIFTIRFWTGIRCGWRWRHFCMLLLVVVVMIRLFIIVNVSAQWKWIGFRIVIDGKWFIAIAGYFVWWWLHGGRLASVFHIEIVWHTKKRETECDRGRDKSTEREKNRRKKTWVFFHRKSDENN